MFNQISKPSLMKRMIATLLIASLIIWAVLMAYYYWLESSAYSAASRQLDRGLVVQTELAKTTNVDHAVQAASLFSTLFNHGYVKANIAVRFVVILENHTGDRLFKSPGTLDAQFTATKNGVFIREVNGTQYTIYRGETAGLIIYLAEPAPPPLWLLTRISSNLTMSVIIALPLLLLPIWFAVNRGLAPLRNLSTSIAKRGPDDLAPLGFINKYTELEPLVQGLDRLFGQLQAKVAREKSFVHDAAHELRTPIAVISAQAHVMSMAETDSERKLAAAYLEDAIFRISNLIEQLLTSARIDSCELKTSLEIDVAQLLRQELANLTPIAMARDIELSLESADVVIARIDANSLQSIFQNLLSNAIRYGQRGGNVVVELAIEHSMLVLTVADDGPGIPIYERELVFERFYRVAGTDVSGSGLGLAIVLQAVTRLAGSVRLESGLGGAGCKFTIQIPI